MDMQTQIDLEQLYAGHHMLERIKSEFRTDDIREYCEEQGLSFTFVVNLLTHMCLHKRAPFGVMVGILNAHRDDLQSTADHIIDCVVANLVNLDTSTLTLIIAVDLSTDVYDDLDRYQFPLPMVIEPQEVKTNWDTGYVTIQESIILKKNHTYKDVCLDHINRVNSVPLTINTEVARMIQNKWKNLDSQKPDEIYEDWMKRRKAFNKYDRVSRDVIESLGIMGGRFWLTHRYDKRGRTYCVGYHVNYQGNDWNKAMVEFYDKELVESF